MKTIANIFLISFLSAAALSIADALFSQQFDLITLGPLSSFATGLAVFFGLVLYLCFAINRHLPKLVLLSPLVYLLWCLLDFWPLEYVAGEQYRFYAAVGQMLLGLLVLQLNLALNKKSRLLAPSQFVGPAFSGRNLLRFSLINIPLFPVIILLLGFATAGSVIEKSTAGFIRLKPNGLYMIEKSYRKAGQTIRLVSMIHLGQQSYYNDLSASLKGKPLLVLAEGVSDEDGRLSGNFSYTKVANLLGLVSQERLAMPGRLVTVESLAELQDIEIGSADILPADIDLREFDERTVAVLNALGKYLLNSDSLIDGYLEFSHWMGENMPPETNQVVMDDLVQKRNSAVLSYLPQALQKYDTLVIPWGALHMPGIEQGVLKKGFRLQKSRERLSIDFLLLPYERLWERLSDN